MKVWEAPKPQGYSGPPCRKFSGLLDDGYCTLKDYAGEEEYRFLNEAPKGSIWRCNHCGQYWHKKTRHFSDDGVFWSATWWYEVRPWNFKARRKIRDVSAPC